MFKFAYPKESNISLKAVHACS